MLMLVLVSLIGFLMENVWSYLATGFIGNRGFIMPFLFVYGLIIFIIYLVLGTPKSTKTLPLYMIGVFVIFTGLQIGYGYAVEALFDFRPWDLSEIPLSIAPYASDPTTPGDGAIQAGPTGSRSYTTTLPVWRFQITGST